VFDHVTIRVSDRGASEHFYDTVLRPIGLEQAGPYPEWGDFSIAEATEDQPLTRRLHIAFFAPCLVSETMLDTSRIFSRSV